MRQRRPETEITRPEVATSADRERVQPRYVTSGSGGREPPRGGQGTSVEVGNTSGGGHLVQQ